MLVTLEETKTYLSIPSGTTTYDNFLNQQIAVLSDSIEKYCGRKFLETSYTQTIYKDQLSSKSDKQISLLHYPLVSIDSIKLDGVDVTGFRIEYEYSKLTKIEGFIGTGEELLIEYTAGYSDTPSPIKQSIFSLIEEKYNKLKSGVAINFGSDVQSISIPGTISIAYDYSLQSNDRKNGFGMLLGNYLNVFDMYRSERRLIGKIEETRYA